MIYYPWDMSRAYKELSSARSMVHCGYEIRTFAIIQKETRCDRGAGGHGGGMSGPHWIFSFGP